MGWRYLAQRALTGVWLDRDLPLRRDELRWELSGPGALRATVSPEIGRLRGLDGRPLLEPGSTLLYAEKDGRLRWGGILNRSTFAGPLWSLEGIGFAGYPNGIPYTGVYYARRDADPTGLFGSIWTHLQTQPDGDLDVQVRLPGNCPVRIGTAEEPYVLTWWEGPDCGAELSELAAETPFDFTESHTWAGADTVTHEVRVHYPRAGRRRDDLVFEQGANVTQVVEVARDTAGYANIVVMVGKGEGNAIVRGEDSVRDGRLRRPAVYTDKLAATTARANAIARRERLARSYGDAVDSITVREHPNAPIGSWDLGDDILVSAILPWLGRVQLWHRIMGWSLLSESTAQLQLQRSDTFRYGAAA